MKNQDLKSKALNFLKPIKKLSVCDWAERYLMLPSTSSEPGRFKVERTPFMRDIMNAFTDDKVHRVIAMTSSQVGKSTALNCVVGRFAHLDPCTIMLIQPTQELAEKYSKTRIVPMIEDSKVLKPLFNNRNQTILEKFFTGGQLLMTGSNSPANLASQPVRIVLCDEVDRFAEDLPGEGDPVKLATARTTTFWNYKIGLFSTPTIKNHSRIEQEFLLGTQEYWSYKCPNCGEWHHLDWRNFVVKEMSRCVDEEMSSKTTKLPIYQTTKLPIYQTTKLPIYQSTHLYRCEDCGFEFTEQEIKSAEQKYIAKNPAALAKGIRSFWVNAFSSPWLSWRQIFEEWQEARGKPALEKVVMNTRFAESYELAADKSLVDENEYLKRRIEYGAELPDGVLILTAAVDVQSNRLEFEVVGWGAGEVRYGIWRDIIQGNPAQYSTWQELDAVLDRQYYFADGRSLKIARTFIDSGYSARQVYSYCAENMHKGRFAIKGKGAPGLPLIYQYTYPKGYGITLTILGVNDGKQEIFSRLKLEGGANAMRYPVDDEYFTRRGYDEIYFKQLFSERQVLKRTSGVAYLAYEPLHKGIRNESLDLAVYNLAACKSLNLDWAELEVEVNSAVQQPEVKQKKSATRSRRLSIF